MQAARYNVADLQAAIMNLVLTQLREEMGKLTLDETFSSRDKMNKNLLEDANAATQPWGVIITRVEVRDIIPSPEVRAQSSQVANSHPRKPTSKRATCHLEFCNQ